MGWEGDGNCAGLHWDTHFVWLQAELRQEEVVYPWWLVSSGWALRGFPG